MLSFLKKSGHKADNKKPPSPTIPPAPQVSGILASEVAKILENPPDHDRIPRFSRLSKSLAEIIKDNESSACFMQYLDVLHASSLLKFLLDVELFKQNAYEQIQFEVERGLFICNLRKFCEGCDCDSSALVVPNDHLEVDFKDEVESNQDLSQINVEALKIYRKYFVYNAPFRIILSRDVLQRLINKIHRNEDKKKIFAEAYSITMTALEKEYYNEYLRSEFHCKYQVDLLTSNQVLISDILYNETAFFYLMEFLEQENCRSLLEFWLAAGNFLEQYQSAEYNPMQAQQDAMVLYEKYFSLQASHPLNLGDRVRFSIEENICAEKGPQPSCFEHVRDIIVHLLKKRFLQPFLQSQLYLKYLSELISTMHASPVTRGMGSSDCSSELSISATNTLLVSASGKFNGSSGSINIDTRQLYDPDSLWKHRRKQGLNFGRINSLGRFETDLEPEPDRKASLESRITKAVKKLVNYEEEKRKEEMAWQVAEMIIKDVTSLTMPEPGSSS